MSTQTERQSDRHSQEVKEVDREKKLKIVEIYQALKQGKLPTNAQIDHALSEMIRAPSLQQRKHELSPDGAKLLRDYQQLLETVRKILNQKNRNELIQHFVYHTQLATSSAKQQIKAPGDLPDTGTLTREAKEDILSVNTPAWNALLTVGRLLTTNAEFRAIVEEITLIMRDIFGDVAYKAGDKAKPTSTQVQALGFVPTEPHRNETKNTGGVPYQSQTQQQAYATQPPPAMGYPQTVPGTVQPQGYPTTQPVAGYPPTAPSGGVQHPTGYPTQAPPSQYPPGQVQPDTTQQYDDTSESRDIKGVVKDKLNKERLQEGATAGKEYLRNKVPEEKQQELIDRVKNVITQIQMDDDYQEAIDYMFYLVGQWANRAQNVGTHASNTGGNVHQDPNVLQAEKELKAIIEEFAQGQSLDPVYANFQKVLGEISEDPELRQYFQEANDFIRRLLKDPGYVQSDESTQLGNNLIDRGRQLFAEKHRDDANAFLNSIGEFTDKLLDDPLSVELGEDIKTFVKDLLLDDKGNYTIKPHLLKDMKSTVLPALLDQIQFIPIPRIEYSDNQYDVTVDNIIVTSKDFMPNLIEIKLHNTLRLAPFGDVDDTGKHTMTLKAHQIEANVQSIQFAYNKKKGFPHMKDHGIADVFIGGRGISVTIKISSETDEDTDQVFGITNVKVTVDKVKLKIHDSKHNLLYKALVPLITGLVKRQIARTMEKKIYDFLLTTDDYVTSAVRQIKSTAGDAKGRLKIGQFNFGNFLRKGESDEYYESDDDREYNRWRKRYDQDPHRRNSEEARGVGPRKVYEREVGPSHNKGQLRVAAPAERQPGDKTDAPWASTAFDPADTNAPQHKQKSAIAV